MIRGEHDHVYRKLLLNAKRIPNFDGPDPVQPCNYVSQPIRRLCRREPDWALWAKRYEAAVFLIRRSNQRQRTESFGSAFRIGPSSILTAGHNVCHEATEEHDPYYSLELVYPFDSPVAVESVRWRWDKNGGVDLAVANVQLPEGHPSTYILTQERLPEVGEAVAAIGFPRIPYRDTGMVMHVGRIESVLSSYVGVKYFTVSFPSGPALSGAPLVDANGYVVGVMIENTFPQLEEGVPERPYGQAIAIGHWREIPNVGSRITSA
ncbi:MAG: serine protease [Planctomycetes bacterium]|nr:serine protease [Planctomycetota bacterium]NOG52790.1 trypsin-like peptidase domain-containing protein [Planctomycetota bacterium]